ADRVQPLRSRAAVVWVASEDCVLAVEDEAAECVRPGAGRSGPRVDAYAAAQDGRVGWYRTEEGKCEPLEEVGRRVGQRERDPSSVQVDSGYVRRQSGAERPRTLDIPEVADSRREGSKLRVERSLDRVPECCGIERRVRRRGKAKACAHRE